MKTFKRFWENSPPEYKDYFFIYLWGILWPLSYLLVTPPATYLVVNEIVIVLWAVVTMIGGGLGITGLLFRDNLLLERFGVKLLMIGPAAFATTQLGTIIFEVSVGDPNWSRIHVIFFALWPFLFLNKRRRQLKNRVDISKKVPLVSEIEGKE